MYQSTMKKLIFPILLIGLLFAATSCTAPAVDVTYCVETEPSGFWMGLWHGIIAPFAFIGSLISDAIQIYDVNNNGGWYDFGFLLGAGTFLGGSSSGSRRMRRRKDRD